NTIPDRTKRMPPPEVRISDANPQTAEYQWGSVQLVHWTAPSGEVLDGLLFKPDGFDPNQQYPMLVYFYEKSSDGLHRHREPDFGRSTINFKMYASRGYLVFVPDIPYHTGYPGESAFNAVMSGVTAMLNRGFVDRSRIGMQGHSWGGYQAAYLVTRTNLFACAEAGAPVSNMTSAYGGIRWGSGLSRQFQYEQTQSRIGGSLWDYPMRYLENSPLFALDKVQTPLLILHNDEDGAVPWYQGIELFVGLRRLGKPAWLLNYNGEPHWPVKLQNRIDFQTRMQQFFDHYLKGAPQPSWMVRGVPPLEKGILQGLEPARKE
ncbi:MAG: S9 family peptidase, partial [Bacteroidetes bacterium]